MKRIILSLALRLSYLIKRIRKKKRPSVWEL